jgi:hypothetical protein
VTLTGSNIDNSKFYFCEKYANLHRFSYMLAISWQKQMAKFGLRKVKKDQNIFLQPLPSLYCQASSQARGRSMARSSNLAHYHHNLLAAINSKLMSARARTDKKNQIFLIYKEILNGAVAKSYMTKDLLIH